MDEKSLGEQPSGEQPAGEEDPGEKPVSEQLSGSPPSSTFSGEPYLDVCQSLTAGGKQATRQKPSFRVEERIVHKHFTNSSPKDSISLQ